MVARPVPLMEREIAGLSMLADPNVSIQELLQKPGIDAQCLLNQAAKHDLIEKMKLLVDNHNADVNGLSKHPTTRMEGTPLMATVESGSFAAAEWLIQHGADTNVLSLPSNEAITSLWCAAEYGYFRLAKLLLDAGADVNVAKASTGNTALYVAVQNGHKAMVMLLLKYGADPNRKINQASDTYEPIVMAIGMQMPALVAQLVNAGARIPYSCMTALANMRERKTTLNINRMEKVTDEEIKVLDELVHVNASLRDDSNYAKARVAEQKGKYRKALRLLRAVPFSCAQLTFDVERIMEHIYGVQGSDGRMSAWKNVPVMSMKRPLSLQFYAWVQVGRKLFTHGGLDTSQSIREPEMDEMWELDIDSRKWTLLKTTGKTPGPRAGHTMFAFQNALYLWGGKAPGGRLKFLNIENVSDSKLYRLDLDQGRGGSFVWEIVKMKSSLKPPPRYEHAGVFYKGKYFITGGNLGGWDLTDDTWSLDMSSLKWTALKRGPKERHCHGMWAGNGKLYVYGGRTVDRHIEDPNLASHTIEDFFTFEIATKSWITAKVTGDRPFDISEFTVLPLYHGKDKYEDEPFSVILFGGYTEHDKSKGPINEAQLKFIYGALAQEFATPYRNRLLRFDLKTEAWTLLLPTRALLPKALSFAAEVRSENGQTQLLIGGGYGITGKNRENMKDLLEFENVSASCGDYVVTPLASTSIFEVFIADEREMCFTRDNLMEKNWTWDFFDQPGDRFPHVQVELSPCSPTLHMGIDLTLEDFAKPLCNSVRPNDDSNLLGLRVTLHGLKGRQDLNGAVARCGYWQKKRERYQIFIPPYECGGPVSMFVKASNLLVAKPFDCADTADIVKSMSRSNSPVSFPLVHMSLATGNDIFKRRPLDILSDIAVDFSEVNNWVDCYHGPVSAKAQVLLRTIAMNKASFESDLMCVLIPSNLIKNGQGKNTAMGKTQLEHRALFNNFYSKLKERDTVRVKNFEANILRKRLKESNTGIGSWLKLVVIMDGIKPAVRRELIVTPDISMKSLHHQVLCPAIGWSNNFHCYAFRRLRGTVDPGTRKFPKAITTKAVRDSIEMLSEECWVGPKNSTAIDSMFQPLYIGGALANDKVITLGDLFNLDRQDEMKLQYVHDFGDWWSHSISVVKYDGEVPSSASVAHLVSGEGNCPPDEIGGYTGYVQTMKRLTGKIEIKAEEIVDERIPEKVDPSNDRWWKYLNSEVRGKINMQSLSNPFAFDTDLTRANLEIAIRQPKQKGGREVDNLTSWNLETGLATSDSNEKCTVDSEKSRSPVKFCAICDVTVALKVCSGCNSIAFCSRDHQLRYWPMHKKDCRRIQKDRE